MMAGFAKNMGPYVMRIYAQPLWLAHATPSFSSFHPSNTTDHTPPLSPHSSLRTSGLPSLTNRFPTFLSPRTSGPSPCCLPADLHRLDLLFWPSPWPEGGQPFLFFLPHGPPGLPSEAGIPSYPFPPGSVCFLSPLCLKTLPFPFKEKSQEPPSSPSLSPFPWPFLSLSAERKTLTSIAARCN